MSAGKHRRLARAVRSLGPRGLTAAVGLAAATATVASLTLIGGASATISPTIVTTPASTGVSGLYVAPNDTRLTNGDHMTGWRMTFPLNGTMKYETPSGAYAAFGGEFCRFESLNSNNDRVSLFVQWDPSGAVNHLLSGQAAVHNVFDVIAEHDTTGACLSGLTNGLSHAGQQLVDEVPSGRTVYLASTQDKHHVIHFIDDAGNNTGGNTAFGGFDWPYNRVGYGTQLDANQLTTPATIPVINAGSLGFRDQAGWALVNRTNLTRAIAVRVRSQTPGGGVLLNPVITGQGGLLIDMGQETN